MFLNTAAVTTYTCPATGRYIVTYTATVSQVSSAAHYKIVTMTFGSDVDSQTAYTGSGTRTYTWKKEGLLNKGDKISISHSQYSFYQITGSVSEVISYVYES